MGKWARAFGVIAAQTAAFFITGSASVAFQVGMAGVATLPRPQIRRNLNAANDVANVPAPPILMTMEENISIPLIYGKTKCSGNVIQISDQLNNANYKAVAVVFSEGHIDTFSNVLCNDVAFASVKDEDGNTISTTSRVGTTTQLPDTARFPIGSQYAYRGIAYLSMSIPYKTILSSGGLPNVTAEVEGKRCRPLANLSAGTPVYTRNPAVILADFLINIEGVATSDIDTTTFQALETYCGAVPSGQTIARYRFDYAFAQGMSVCDARYVIEASFHGRAIRSQGKWKVVYEKTGSSVYSFTIDNIVQASLSWRKDECKNIFRIFYLNSGDGYREDVIEIRNEESISDIGDRIFEERSYYITDGEVARRRAQFRHDKSKYCPTTCQLTGFPGSAKLEVLDVVDVTHSTPGWTAKIFVITEKEQDEFGIPSFVMEEYNASVYGDIAASVQANAETTLPSPFAVPATITDLALTLVYKLMDDGTYLSQVKATFTKLVSVFPLKYEVWFRWGSEAVRYHGETETGTYYIDAPEIATYYVKVKAVNVGTGIKGEFCAEVSLVVIARTVPALAGFTVVTNYEDLGLYSIGIQREIMQQLENFYDPDNAENIVPVVVTDFLYTEQSIKHIEVQAVLPHYTGAVYMSGTAAAAGNQLTDAINDWTAFVGSAVGQKLISFTTNTDDDGTIHTIQSIASDGGTGTIITVSGSPKSGKYYIVSAQDMT